MTLDEGTIHWAGLTMGAKGTAQFDRLTGLTDRPRSIIDNPLPQRLHDPAVPGWADIGWRQIAAENAHVDGDANIRLLRSAFSDILTIRELTFADASIAAGDLMVAAVADRCEYGRGAIEHTQREWTPSLQWLAADSTIYSAAVTTAAFGGGSGAASSDVDVTNAGTFQTPSGRAWSIEITAGAAGASNPAVFCPDTGQRVTWLGLHLAAGQTMTLDVNRNSWIGSLGLDGFTGHFPDWPMIPTGDSTFRVSCSSGLVKGTLTYRSSW